MTYVRALGSVASAGGVGYEDIFLLLAEALV